MTEEVSHYSSVSVLNEVLSKRRSTHRQSAIHTSQLYGRLGSSKERNELGSIATIPDMESFESTERKSEPIPIEPPPRKKVFNIRKHFQFIRRMAIEETFVNIQRNLSIYLTSTLCDKPKAEKVETPQNMFSWSEEDFYSRRHVNNTAWIEVFIRQLSRPCIERKKLQVDIKEIIKYMSLIHDEFRGQDTKIITILQSIYDFLNIAEKLGNTLNENAEKKEHLGRSYHGHTLKKTEEAARRNKINQLEYTLFQSHVFDPIEVRYQLRYYKMAVEEFREKKRAEQEAITKQIETLKKQTQVENYCSQCTVNALYAEIGKFRNRIEFMEALYDKQADKYDKTINYKRFNMDKRRTQRNYLEEQVQRFREEIAQIKLMEMQEAERLKSALRRKLSQHRAAKLLADAAKNKKKKK